MLSKVHEIEKAIALRKKGWSYRDILKEVPVAKSTLSKHLKDLPLTKSEKHYLKSRRDSNISHGRIKAAAASHSRRIERDRELLDESRKEFANWHSDPLFFTGIALYWAEGAKRNSIFAFTNSDPQMVSLMVAWVTKFLGVPSAHMRARLYTHKPFANEGGEVFWATTCSIPLSNFRRTIYKPTGLLVKKRPGYKGCIRIELAKVAYLRKMHFWQQMLIEHYRIAG